MAKITVIQRKVNKGTIQPLSVRYSHPCAETGKNKDYIVAAGVKCDTRHFKGGRVVGVANAPELNADIQEVYTRMEQARRNVEMMGHAPTAERVKAAYINVPAIERKVGILRDQWKADGLSQIEVLEHELADLLAAVEAKKAEIVAVKIEIGTHQPEMISELIPVFIAHRNELKPKNAKRGKKTFSKSTQYQYEQLRNQLLKFNPRLSIRAIDKKMIEEIESYFVEERYLNTSTFTLINKLVAVLNHFQPEYGLDKSYKDYTFDLPMREESVICLTTEELTAFRKADFSHKHPLAQRAGDKVKDLALLMSETALRYSDSAITRTDINGGYIIKNQQKTGGRVQIPFTDRLRVICEKYDYKLKGGKIDGFNATFRRLLSMLNVPSLHEEITVMNYCGTEEVPDTRKKYEHCGAHTLRRTMINQCLIRNLRYDKITKITGHKDFETFQTYIDRDTKAAEMDAVFDFLNDEETPMMRVA